MSIHHGERQAPPIPTAEKIVEPATTEENRANDTASAEPEHSDDNIINMTGLARLDVVEKRKPISSRRKQVIAGVALGLTGLVGGVILGRGGGNNHEQASLTPETTASAPANLNPASAPELPPTQAPSAIETAPAETLEPLSELYQKILAGEAYPQVSGDANPALAVAELGKQTAAGITLDRPDIVSDAYFDTGAGFMRDNDLNIESFAKKAFQDISPSVAPLAPEFRPYLFERDWSKVISVKPTHFNALDGQVMTNGWEVKIQGTDKFVSRSSKKSDPPQGTFTYTATVYLAPGTLYNKDGTERGHFMKIAGMDASDFVKAYRKDPNLRQDNNLAQIRTPY